MLARIWNNYTSGYIKCYNHFVKLFGTFLCCCLVTKPYLILCDLMDCSTPGFPVLHYLLEFAQTHVHRVNENESCSIVSNSLWPHGLYSPWNSPGQNTGVDSLSLLQGIFLTQESNQGLLYCRWILYQMTIKEASKSVMLSSYLILCHTLLLLPSIFWGFSNELALRIRWFPRQTIEHHSNPSLCPNY